MEIIGEVGMEDIKIIEEEGFNTMAKANRLIEEEAAHLSGEATSTKDSLKTLDLHSDFKTLVDMVTHLGMDSTLRS